MPLRELGVILLVLVVIFVFGQLWFHFVETLLRWLKKLFVRHKEPSKWHPLPVEQEENSDV